MNFPFYIARRYLVSRKSHHIINIISWISMASVMIGTMALIIVLSVFNGFDQLVSSLFNSFNPDILIQVKAGKTFDSTSVDEGRIRLIPGVRYLSEVIEENALIKYKDKQSIVTIKGVDAVYPQMSGLDTMMTEGNFLLQQGDKNFAVLGYGVAWYIGANLEDYVNPISVYVPRRTGSFSTGIENAFNNEVIFPSGYFSIQQDFDVKYVILPIRFVRKLLEYNKEITSLEVDLVPGADHAAIQRQIAAIAGDRFTVKNRFQQQEIFYKIMKSEKWAIFLILSFILLIATFNVVGSLSMLILDKRQDIAMLQSLGAGLPAVKRIFLMEGLLISFIGAISGLIIGALVCWLQMRFGFVKLGAADSTFVVDA
ncbi:MAG TPA: ABC transporter permease, partial [Bacteroidales bacterium]|nr:ABC transporter permease [Bacteroidales bacterium]